jgi:hypothetical protein
MGFGLTILRLMYGSAWPQRMEMSLLLHYATLKQKGSPLRPLHMLKQEREKSAKLYRQKTRTTDGKTLICIGPSGG